MPLYSTTHALVLPTVGFQVTDAPWRFPEPYIKRNGFRIPAEKLLFQRFRYKENIVDEDSEWYALAYEGPQARSYVGVWEA